MLFTISYAGNDACDLGYLLHKNPSRPQTADFSFGKVHIFYPEAAPELCTAALLLDIDPLDLSRGKAGSRGQALFDYVNDRLYVSSSFMSTAISRVYGTAMSGRCDQKQALADSALDLSASLTMLPCRGSTSMLERVFGPLGYEISWEEFPLDEKFPSWGLASYVNLKLRARLRLRDLLRQIYVLIPVFDFRKHYWMDKAELDKLIRHGEGWLEDHPEKSFITRRYFPGLRRFTRLALERLDNGTGGSSLAIEEDEERPASLNELRLTEVYNELKAGGAKTVIDLGCGEGKLLELLIKDKSFNRIAGTDVSLRTLQYAAERLNGEISGANQDKQDKQERLSLFQGSLCYRDKRFKGYDAAALVEVIEHLEKHRLPSLASVIFGDAAPRTLIVTTPNREYNVIYENISPESFRHQDHRFEWSREEFRSWAEETALRYGYEVRFKDIGPCHGEYGSPTQMGIFTKTSGSGESSGPDIQDGET